MTKDLNDYARECHTANQRWWRDPLTNAPLMRNFGELIALCHSELSEALEGHRKNLNDDKLPHRQMVEVELADCLIRIFDLAGAHGFDLEGAYNEKMAYNAQRADHTHAARLQAGRLGFLFHAR
jgi:NTP pyrophosphatase (non-canonical NTP hydrolase)